MTEPEGPKPLSLDWLLDPVPAISFVRIEVLSGKAEVDGFSGVFNPPGQSR